MKQALLAFVIAGIVVLAGGTASCGSPPSTARAQASSAAAPPIQTGAAPASAPAASAPPLSSGAPASGPGSPAAAVPAQLGADIAADDAGGGIESITGEYGAGATGRRLIDGSASTGWPSPVHKFAFPMEVVFSFYNHQSALVGAVAIDAGEDPALAPKDVEIWTSPDSATDHFVKAAAAQANGGPIAFPPVETRFVKLRVLSNAQGDAVKPQNRTLSIGEVRILEAKRDGYTPLAARYADIANWKRSPRWAAQRGIEWLQPAAVKWGNSNRCFGCHVQAQALMGLTIAKKNDYIVSEQAAKDLAEYTQSQQKPDGSFIRDNEGSTAFAGMGLAYWDEFANLKSNAALIKSADWLLARQGPEGLLAKKGGCSTLTVTQGPFTQTLNGLVALRRANEETGDNRYKEAADRALAAIAAAEPVTTQDKVFKILALARFGAEAQKAAMHQVVEQLILEQKGGGWRECANHISAQAKESLGPNVFSTAQVLYAFRQAGMSVSASPFIKGVKYLLETQRDDGSWPADKSTWHTQGAPHAPTMWAIIALAGSFGVSKTGGLQIATELSPEQAAVRRNLEIILDASGSMKLPLGRSTRIAVARQVLRDVLGKIPDDFNVGLRLYSHRYSARDTKTCTDTELAVPIRKLDRQKILATVDRIQPRGETPLVYSTLQTAGDLAGAGGGSVILITDGEETCGGDPVKAAEQLKSAGIPITLNIVGFTLKGKQVEQQLTEFAESTGGHYYSAQDGAALTRALTTAAITKFPYTVFDASGAQVAKGTAGPFGETLQPGTYKVVVSAADQELTASVDVAVGSEVVLKVVWRGDRFELVRETPGAAPGAKQ